MSEPEYDWLMQADEESSMLDNGARVWRYDGEGAICGTFSPADVWLPITTLPPGHEGTILVWGVLGDDFAPDTHEAFSGPARSKCFKSVRSEFVPRCNTRLGPPQSELMLIRGVTHWRPKPKAPLPE
jgi:hypothetical protein